MLTPLLSNRRRRRVMAGGFTPGDDPNCLFHTIADNYGASDSATIPTLIDETANGNDFTQGADSKRFTYHQNVINGHGVARGDGVDDYYALGSVIDASATGMLIGVFRLTSALQDNQVIFSIGDTGANNDWFTLRPYRTSANPQMSIRHLISGSANAIRGSTTIVAATTYLMEWHGQNTQWTLELNENNETENVVSGSNNGDWAGDVVGADDTYIGARVRSSPAWYLKGEFAELSYHGPRPNAARRTDIISYYVDKFGPF